MADFYFGSGPTASRPSGAADGTKFFDTTLDIPIWAFGGACAAPPPAGSSTWSPNQYGAPKAPAPGATPAAGPRPGLLNSGGALPTYMGP